MAQTVVRLLEDLRSLDRPSDQPVKEQNGVSDEQRPPKRPWEDMAREGEPPSAIVHYDVSDVPLCFRPSVPARRPC